MHGFDEYQRAVSVGAVTPELSKGRMLLIHALGLNGEAADYAELLTALDPTLANLASKLQSAAGQFAKHVRATVFHRPTNPQLMAHKAKLALGNLLRTVAATATALEIRLSDVAQASLTEKEKANASDD